MEAQVGLILFNLELSWLLLLRTSTFFLSTSGEQHRQTTKN